MGDLSTPFRAVQVYEEIGRPDNKFYNFDEWELPRGAAAEIIQGEPTVSFPRELSGQLTRMYARFVWPKETTGHLNPGAPEGGAGRLYQFVAKASFESLEHAGFLAPIFLRISGWSSGARRRGDEERKLYMCSGDSFCLFNVQSKDYGQLSAQSWRPAQETEWKQAKPYSYWDTATVGLTSSSWTSFPKAAASTLTPTQFELEHTEVLINFPSFISHPAAIKRRLNASTLAQG